MIDREFIIDACSEEAASLSPTEDLMPLVLELY